MNWLLDAAPAIRFCSNAESILVAPLRRPLKLALSCTAVAIPRTYVMNFPRTVGTSRPYERNRSLRIDRKDHLHTDSQ